MTMLLMSPIKIHFETLDYKIALDSVKSPFFGQPKLGPSFILSINWCLL
jgi:hypothetical protein